MLDDREDNEKLLFETEQAFKSLRLVDDNECSAPKHLPETELLLLLILISL
jgi:hypothetical protein